MKIWIVALMCWPLLLHGQEILPLRQQAAVIDQILEERLDVLLPQLMRQNGLDMWVIISREYNEDPVMRTMLPAEWLSARRRTMMIFYDQGDSLGVEKIAIARYDVGKLLKGAWNLDVYPDQWEALVNHIKSRNPKKIGINTSANFGHADGLVHTEHEELMAHLPPDLQGRVVSAENLAVAWLETRTERELVLYRQICNISHQILGEALSDEVIHPGITTTDDVVWWLRQRVNDLGLDTWFHPSCSVQRISPESFEHLRAFSARPSNEVIMPGDLVHIDFGITYLRLNTDQQQHAYILKDGETEAPKALQDAFARANRVQDILTSKFKTGKTGNEILREALQQAEKEGIVASIYTHPIGLHGHAAGPTIGLWDQQKGVKGAGDYPLHANTAYSIELNAATEVPEWDKVVRIMLEEDGYFTGQEFRYIDGRQTILHLVR